MRRFHFDDEFTDVAIVNNVNNEKTIASNPPIIHTKFHVNMIKTHFQDKYDDDYDGGAIHIRGQWILKRTTYRLIIFIVFMVSIMFSLYSFFPAQDVKSAYNYPIKEMDKNGIIFAESDYKIITDKDINKLKSNHPNDFKEVLQWAINEIYARKGFQFGNNQYLEFYSQFDWYKPQKISQKSFLKNLNYYEMKNINKLAQIRNSFK